MQELEFLDVPPDIARICEGLRDTGYDLNMAVADIVDNSIAAGATRVDIRARIDNENNIALSLADNGHGMDKDALINAMRYGSATHAGEVQLGKFGLGLKTASTAFCRKLLVSSRSAESEMTLTAMWDLDLLEAQQRWALALAPAGELEQTLLAEVAGSGPGTVVIWDRVDRVLLRAQLGAGDSPELAAAALERMLTALRKHLGSVFQRFLDPDDARARTVTLTLNGQIIFPWDPFCSRTGGQREEIVYLNASTPVGDFPIIVESYLLPREEEFADANAASLAAISTENQGIFVYRENRLIHGPDWLGLFPQEPPFSLLRISLSFDSALDDLFMVDIKKSRILMNEQLYSWLKDIFLPVHRAAAEERYKKGQAGAARENSAALHQGADKGILHALPTLVLPKVLSMNQMEHKVVLENTLGAQRLPMPVFYASAHTRFALTEELGGPLWQPTCITGENGGQLGILLNTAHPFYQKIYMAHASDAPLIEALDYLLFSLACAEQNHLDAEHAALAKALRQEASANLEMLCKGLPD